jgi:hypothetical protein
MHRFAIAILVVFILTPAALAQVVYPVQQVRYVSASTTSVDPNDPSQVETIEYFVTATGFDTWQEDVRAEALDAPRWANAGQYSTFSPTDLDAFGATDIGLTAGGNYYTSYVTDGATGYGMRFAVPAAATYDLLGYASVEFTADSFDFDWWMDVITSIELRQIAGPTLYSDEISIHMTAQDFQPHQIVELPIALAGELTPGVYELYVLANAHGEVPWGTWPGPPLKGEASFVVTAEFAPVPPDVPGEGDLDGDGDVDIVDFARFQRGMTGPL